ncbi:MAG: hypothetical protein JSW58_12125 [Candidatus Latescibacterota bacterium]|nr:MAG: hypothetical protein JSW58_12125 [Candidatus Latescibacterota bacterium]
MKRFLLLALALAVLHIPAMAFGQGGTIAVFADPIGEDCHPRDVAPGILQVYVVHTNTEGVTASQFMVRTGDGFEGVYLGEYLADPNDVAIGDAFAGVQMGYGECLSAPIHLITMSFYVTGSSPECCYFEVVEYPRSDPPGINAVDCDMNLVDAEGGTTFVNPDGNCVCDVPGGPTPVELTTWSRVKAMYAGN